VARDEISAAARARTYHPRYQIIDLLCFTISEDAIASREEGVKSQAAQEEKPSQPQSSWSFLMRRIRSCHEPEEILSTTPLGFLESLTSTNGL
jgi:hypothetical protein